MGPIGGKLITSNDYVYVHALCVVTLIAALSISFNLTSTHVHQLMGYIIYYTLLPNYVIVNAY